MPVLRYIGHLEKTLVDVAALEYGKVVTVSEELGKQLLETFGNEWEEVKQEAEKVVDEVEAEVKKVTRAKSADKDKSE